MDGDERPGAPERDEHDPEEFGTTEGTSDQLPEEGPRETVPSGSNRHGKRASEEDR